MDILDLFYNYVVKEASQGKIDCFFHYNVIFNTYLVESDNYIVSSINNEEVFIPTLVIKNKVLFDMLLTRYVRLANNFYSNTCFDDEKIKDIFNNLPNNVCKEKLILATLWLNATPEDFNDPINFLYKRIGFLQSNEFNEKQDIGYSTILKSELFLERKKDDINFETPYKLVCSLESASGYYYLPEIRYGIYNKTVYIFAIQNGENNSTRLSKSLNRLMYKVGEGFDTTRDNFELYGVGNLQDITPSFLVSLNIALSYFHSLGYRKIIIPNFLVSRWNSNIIAINRAELDCLERIKFENEQIEIQQNITEKFIRTFLRLVHHYEGISVSSFPYDLDSNLIIELDEQIQSNNKLFEETVSLVRKKLEINSSFWFL